MRGDVKRSKGQFTYRTRVDFGKITFLGTSNLLFSEIGRPTYGASYRYCS